MFAFLLFSVHSTEEELELTPDEYKEIAKAVITVLFKDGKCLTEINDISDAIIHSRSGCGTTVPAADGLYNEMSHYKQYQNNFNTTNGLLLQQLKNQVSEAAKTSLTGTITSPSDLRYSAICLTLGSYSFKAQYSIPYTCEQKDDGKYCSLSGSVNLSGQDYWDFDDVPSYSWLKNLLFEKIPKWLVELRTDNMQPFYITYNLDQSYEFTIKV